MRRVVLALTMLAMIFLAAGFMVDRSPDQLVTTGSPGGGQAPTASVTGVEPTRSDPARSEPRTLRNQYGEEIPLGVHGPPPVPSPGAGPPTSDASTRMHIIRNGQLWTVEVPTIRTPNGISTAPNADQIINSQLPVMWRCSDEVQSGCWDRPGDPPGNPEIRDRPRP